MTLAGFTPYVNKKVDVVDFTRLFIILFIVIDIVIESIGYHIYVYVCLITGCHRRHIIRLRFYRVGWSKTGLE